LIHRRETSARARRREKGESIAEDKSPSYFFRNVIYGNVCRQKRSHERDLMKSRLWDVEPPVVNLDLLIQ